MVQVHYPIQKSSVSVKVAREILVPRKAIKCGQTTIYAEAMELVDPTTRPWDPTYAVLPSRKWVYRFVAD